MDLPVPFFLAAFSAFLHSHGGTGSGSAHNPTMASRAAASAAESCQSASKSFQVSASNSFQLLRLI